MLHDIIISCALAMVGVGVWGVSGSYFLSLIVIGAAIYLLYIVGALKG